MKFWRPKMGYWGPQMGFRGSQMGFWGPQMDSGARIWAFRTHCSIFEILEAKDGIHGAHIGFWVPKVHIRDFGAHRWDSRTHSCDYRAYGTSVSHHLIEVGRLRKPFSAEFYLAMPPSVHPSTHNCGDYKPD